MELSKRLNIYGRTFNRMNEIAEIRAAIGTKDFNYSAMNAFLIGL